MNDSANYAKIVAWSEEDQHYIGYAPGIVSGGCCHGDDEKEVFDELCEIVDELIEIVRQDGTPLPPPTAGYYYGDTLNEFLTKSLQSTGA